MCLKLRLVQETVAEFIPACAAGCAWWGSRLGSGPSRSHTPRPLFSSVKWAQPRRPLGSKVAQPAPRDSGGAGCWPWLSSSGECRGAPCPLCHVACSHADSTPLPPRPRRVYLNRSQCVFVQTLGGGRGPSCRPSVTWPFPLPKQCPHPTLRAQCPWSRAPQEAVRPWGSCSGGRSSELLLSGSRRGQVAQ